MSNSFLFAPALLRTHSFVFFAVLETCRIFLSAYISKARRRVSSFFLSVQPHEWGRNPSGLSQNRSKQQQSSDQDSNKMRSATEGGWSGSAARAAALTGNFLCSHYAQCSGLGCLDHCVNINLLTYLN